MPVAERKPISSFTIVPAFTVKPIYYKDYKGRTISVPINNYVYVDTVAGIALIGNDHVEIAHDEYFAVDF
jgi:hypothetical protein